MRRALFFNSSLIASAIFAVMPTMFDCAARDGGRTGIAAALVCPPLPAAATPVRIVQADNACLTRCLDDRGRHSFVCVSSTPEISIARLACTTNGRHAWETCRAAC